MYFPRADGPTRGVSPRSPDVALPDWWAMIDEGVFEAFDDWMHQQNSLINKEKLSPFDLDIPLDELSPHDGELRTFDHPVVEPPVNVAESLGETGDVIESFSDQGSDSTLCAETLAILESFSDKQIFRAKGVVGFPSAGALDLYSGRAGIAIASWSKWVALGCCASIGLDLLTTIC